MLDSVPLPQVLYQSKKKTPLQMDVTAAMLSLSLHGIILPHSFLPFCDCIGVLFVITVMQYIPA